MRFNSFEFAIFLVVVLGLAPWCRGRARHGLLLVASYVFYGSWSPPFLILLWFSTGLDYTVGRLLAATESAPRRKALLGVSLLGNLGLLVYFKYGNFFLDNLAFVSGVDPEPYYLDVVIPLGISFYTFQTLSYTIDVYRGRAQACRSLLDFALYITFFPQLIAGPILRINDFLPQLRRQEPVTQAEILRGVELLGLGLFKKVVIADNLAILVDRVFSDPLAYGTGATLIASAAFWIQVYCDFSGYSTMARGLASLLGFQLPRNFDFPMLRSDPVSYRRAWHSTMSRWFTDYVYIPLGGSRCSSARWALNIMLVWTLTGLWHGAGWNFIAWGAYNGVNLVVYSLVMKHKRWSLPAFPGKKLCGWLCQVALLLPSNVFFRSQSISEAWIMLKRLYVPTPGLSVDPLWGLAVLLCLAIHTLCFFHYKEDLLQRLAWPGRVTVATTAALGIALLGATARPFVYFQF